MTRALLVAGALGFAAAGTVLVQQANDASDRQARIAEAAGEAGGLASLYLSEAAAARAYFLGGSDLALSEFNQARTRAASQSRRLAKLLTETALLPHLDTVDKRAHVWADQTLDPIIELKRSVGRAGDISDSYRMSLARQRFDDLLKSTDLLRSEIDQSRQTIVDSAREAHGRVVGFFAGIAGAIGLLLVLVWRDGRRIEATQNNAGVVKPVV